MLLINICVLVGAVLTPPSLWWLYSTHIVLLCLYQLAKRNWRELTLVGISLFALTYAQVWFGLSSSNSTQSFDVYWYSDNACYLAKWPLENERIYFIQGGKHFYGVPCEKQYVVADSQKIAVRAADRFGSWAQRYAYAKNAGAFAFIPFEEQAQQSLSSDYFSEFASWRFSLSLVKGDRSLWSERDKWLVNYLGLAHLFVVSGLHVGFVCFLAFACVRLVWQIGVRMRWRLVSRRWLEFGFAVPCCISYTVWSGMGEPAIRATFMAFVFLLIRASFRHYPSYLVLGLCAWLMLLLWPGRSLDASFWLSFSFVLLLIMLVNKVPSRGRYFFVQCLLSLFAVLLTWGWQSSISSLSVLANLVMIPFVALVWFPGALISFAEYQFFQHFSFYSWLDDLMIYIYERVEYYLYLAPELEIVQSSGLGMKVAMIFIAYLGVVYLPLVRGYVLLVGVLVCLLWPKGWSNIDLVIATEGRGLITMDRQFGGMQQGVFVVTAQGYSSVVEFDAYQVLSENWTLVVLPENHKKALMLKALAVNTIAMSYGERLGVHQDGSHYKVRSSSCYRVLNLLKTDGCEHAETLESVLN